MPTRPTIRGAARRLFRMSADDGLPPLPGILTHRPQQPSAWLLEELVDAAGCNLVPPPAQAPDPPSIAAAFAALRQASLDYEVGSGVPLASHFWTHHAAFHSGEMARQLLATARRGHPVQGFLALYATDIHSPLLFSPGVMPFRVPTGIHAQPDVSGPFLALIACQAAPDGRAEPVAVQAVPIFHGRRFLPVRSDLDRDVLRALEHLQVALDAHGVECSIQRIRPDAHSTPTLLVVTTTAQDSFKRQIRIAVDPAGIAEPGVAGQADFCVTQQSWTDGKFIAWLARVVADPAGRTPVIGSPTKAGPTFSDSSPFAAEAT